MKKDKWIWMPHPAHLCVASNCMFVMATYVGKYIVSTVGEWSPRFGPNSEKEEFQEIGYNRKYETMVFKAKRSKSECCQFEVADYDHVDMQGYNEAEEARKGHMKLCNKWSNKGKLNEVQKIIRRKTK